MTYAFKKFVGALAGPLAVAFVLLAIAAGLRASGRRRAAAWVIAIAGVIAYVGSVPLCGELMIGALERQHPSAVLGALPQAEYIVVLGSDYSPRSDIPVTGALDSDGLARIVEGVRLGKLMSSAKLIVSGGAPEGRGRSAHGYAQLARDLGISQSSLIVLDTPLDTAAEACSIAGMLGTQPFVLVTSAYHMPRAMRLMQLAGARPIPAPTGQRVKQAVRWGWHALLPSSAGLRMTEQALHEYLGLLLIAGSKRGFCG